MVAHRMGLAGCPGNFSVPSVPGLFDNLRLRMG